MENEKMNGSYLPKIYYPELRGMTGSVNSALLFRQIEYWFYKKEYEPFYKYLEAPKTDTKAYHDGDSWSEELGMTKYEVRNAFDKIGIAWKSYKQATEYGCGDFGAENERFYCSKTNKITKMTYYYRNDEVVAETIATNELEYCFQFDKDDTPRE